MTHFAPGLRPPGNFLPLALYALDPCAPAFDAMRRPATPARTRELETIPRRRAILVDWLLAGLGVRPFGNYPVDKPRCLAEALAGLWQPLPLGGAQFAPELHFFDNQPVIYFFP